MEWGGYIIKKNIFPWIWLRIVYFQRVCGDFLCARSLSPSPSSSFTVSAFSLPADRSAQCNNTKYLSICLLVEWMTFLNKNHRINWGHLFSLYSSFSFKRAHLLWLVYTAMYTDYGFYFFWLNWELLLTWILLNLQDPTGSIQWKVLTAGHLTFCFCYNFKSLFNIKDLLVFSWPFLVFFM